MTPDIRYVNPGKNICQKCGEKVVHPRRKYKICMDCLIEVVMGEEEAQTWTEGYKPKLRPRPSVDGKQHIPEPPL